MLQIQRMKGGSVVTKQMPRDCVAAVTHTIFDATQVKRYGTCDMRKGVWCTSGRTLLLGRVQFGPSSKRPNLTTHHSGINLVAKFIFLNIPANKAFEYVVLPKNRIHG